MAPSRPKSHLPGSRNQVHGHVAHAMGRLRTPFIFPCDHVSVEKSGPPPPPLAKKGVTLIFLPYVAACNLPFTIITHVCKTKGVNDNHMV
eukprot:COSAG01_NODE_4417_length_5046_cov_164.804730_2_plen_90_part_00